MTYGIGLATLIAFNGRLMLHQLTAVQQNSRSCAHGRKAEIGVVKDAEEAGLWPDILNRVCHLQTGATDGGLNPAKQ